jgi:hypothetical protein
MKKLATLLFTFALAFTLAMPAFAQDTASGDAAPKADKASKKEKKAAKKASKKSKKEKKGEMTPKS